MTTAQAVSKVLTKAGHVKSVTTPTRIRGWHESTRGFQARKWDDNGTVSVEHRSGLFRGGDAEPDLAKYEDALTAAGFTVERGYGSRLLVTKDKP